MDPASWAYWDDDSEILTARTALDGIDARQRGLETLDEIERSSVDFYASIRSLYRQNRAAEIDNGKTDIDQLPEIDDSLDDDY
jgi:phospholipid-binding lipoprotein MlaA